MNKLKVYKFIVIKKKVTPSLDTGVWLGASQEEQTKNVVTPILGIPILLRFPRHQPLVHHKQRKISFVHANVFA